MAKYIKKKALKNAIDCCTWYHINKNGELVEGANSSEHEPLYKYSDIKRIIKSLPTRKFNDEPQTDCPKLINEVVKLDMSREDKFKVMELLERHCGKCRHYLFTDIDGHYCEHETYGQPCGYEPKDEPQTERSE